MTPPAAREAAARHSAEVELFSLAGHDGLLREVNGAFARLLGMPAEEMAGCSSSGSCTPRISAPSWRGSPRSSAGPRRCCSNAASSSATAPASTCEWVARPVEGTDCWWAAGRGMSAFHRVLAEQVDLRARFDLALGQSTAAMWELSLPAGRHLEGAGRRAARGQVRRRAGRRRGSRGPRGRP